MSNLAEPIGPQLRRRRRALELKQQDVARVAGMTPAYLARIESGRVKRPSWDIVQRIESAIEQLQPEQQEQTL